MAAGRRAVVFYSDDARPAAARRAGADPRRAAREDHRAAPRLDGRQPRRWASRPARAPPTGRQRGRRSSSSPEAQHGTELATRLACRTGGAVLTDALEHRGRRRSACAAARSVYSGHLIGRFELSARPWCVTIDACWSEDRRGPPRGAGSGSRRAVRYRRDTARPGAGAVRGRRARRGARDRRPRRAAGSWWWRATAPAAARRPSASPGGPAHGRRLRREPAGGDERLGAHGPAHRRLGHPQRAGAVHRRRGLGRAGASTGASRTRGFIVARQPRRAGPDRGRNSDAVAPRRRRRRRSRRWPRSSSRGTRAHRVTSDGRPARRRRARACARRPVAGPADAGRAAGRQASSRGDAARAAV